MYRFTIVQTALQPRQQVIAMTAMLAAVLGVVAALTHSATASGTGLSAAAGYAVVLVPAVLWLRARPLAVLVGTALISAELARVPLHLIRHRRHGRQVWA
ncbi:hypothetical protein F7Q99_38975 [Streptomyces kaniharaensis]|uniref:Uncharacterized protein n=1 Tax=Streptomyces kaniharaensis TaxID=212423 RepID=A0A6N7L1Y0_9ACTN|nr:hypothetical protein [Streptomyces kaniharaensis]MQS18016.1 hypothetical protein [Streptomyces kaniharaensis]